MSKPGKTRRTTETVTRDVAAAKKGEFVRKNAKRLIHQPFSYPEGEDVPPKKVLRRRKPERD